MNNAAGRRIYGFSDRCSPFSLVKCLARAEQAESPLDVAGQIGPAAGSGQIASGGCGPDRIRKLAGLGIGRGQKC